MKSGRFVQTIVALLIVLLLLSFVSVAHAQNRSVPSGGQSYAKAQVQQIINQGTTTQYGYTTRHQKLKLLLLDGDDAGKTVTVDYGQEINLDKSQLANVGDAFIIENTATINQPPSYQVVDKYRLDQLTGIMVIFFLAIIILSGWKGFGSIIGLIVSLGVVMGFVVPEIIRGANPLFVSIIGCLIIMVATIYLAHGFSKKTTIALISTFVTLTATWILSTFFVNITHLGGLGSQDAYDLKMGPMANIDLRGLLLGGILIGTLGALDDVTTGLAVSVYELAKANPTYTFKKLFRSGIAIGQEHIASLVNTLVLAYAGVSLPILLTLLINPNHDPLWVILNSEIIVEEIVRTLAGSIGLIAAVPLTTFLASLYYSFLKEGRS